ncbi:MAG: type II toxin-antitoxin system VapC family toxin [Pseudomonadota bacterium]
MTSLIVDASVAVKWFVDEEDTDRATLLLERAERICAPRIILGEVANAIWKTVRRGDMSQELGAEAVADLPRFVTLLFDTDHFMADALRIACALDHPIYDCLYVESARRLKLPLVTADARMARKFSAGPYAQHIIPLSDWRP